MLPTFRIWHELSKKVSWASVASKLWILEVKIGGTSLCSVLAKLRSPPPPIEVVLEAHRCSEVVGFGQSFLSM